MKIAGMLILALGLALGAFSLSMDVSVQVPAQDYGYGVKTPALEVANIDRMAQRQNYMIFSGILSVVGAILLGFGSMGQRVHATAKAESDTPLPQLAPEVRPALDPTSVSICPSCRFMGSGDATSCARCKAPFPA